MEKITIRLKPAESSYNIAMGAGIMRAELTGLGKGSAIITDSNVAELYGRALQKSLQCSLLVFPAGEQNKNRKTKDYLVDELQKLRFGRNTLVIALGGGVVGDVAGYASAVFNRGVPFIQIPTTLVAQADSSIGGKVGINTPHGKNLEGAFHHPKKVIIDVETLKTLQDIEFRQGLAETIKHALVSDAAFFEYLKRNMKHILARDSKCLLHIAKQNCRIKAGIVEQDPEEKGLRRILNYGHTTGHAIEKLSGYKIRHGDAVAIGMMAEGRMAQCAEQLAQQERLLKMAGLPTTLPKEISAEELIQATWSDKKGAEGRARYALPAGIGKMQEFAGEYCTAVDDRAVKRALEPLQDNL